MINDIIIRKPVAADFEQWKKCWQEYLAFYEATLEDDMINLAWKRMNSGDEHEFIAIGAFSADHKMVGLIHYLYHRHGWKRMNVCYLQDLFVLQSHRRLNIATKLIESLYQQARDYGAEQVYWLTQDFNHGARKLYDEVATQTSFIKYSHDL